jgi:hypothetical protein
MNNKQYVLGEVEYGYSLQFKKWTFTIKDYTFITPLKGGNTTGQKIARLVQAGYIRAKGQGIDRLAKANIEQVLERAAVNV